METATFSEILRLYGPLAAIVALFLWWVARRVASGKITIISASGSELSARAEAAEAEVKRINLCLVHQRHEADMARKDLLEYLQKDSQRLRLVEVEACAAKEDKP